MKRKAFLGAVSFLAVLSLSLPYGTFSMLALTSAANAESSVKVEKPCSKNCIPNTTTRPTTLPPLTRPTTLPPMIRTVPTERMTIIITRGP
jgi:hypothetical protein